MSPDIMDLAESGGQIEGHQQRDGPGPPPATRWDQARRADTPDPWKTEPQGSEGSLGGVTSASRHANVGI